MACVDRAILAMSHQWLAFAPARRGLHAALGDKTSLHNRRNARNAIEYGNPRYRHRKPTWSAADQLRANSNLSPAGIFFTCAGADFLALCRLSIWRNRARLAEKARAAEEARAAVAEEGVEASTLPGEAAVESSIRKLPDRHVA